MSDNKPKPAPPTDPKRLDVEGIRSYAGVVMEIRSTTGMKGKAGRVYLDRVLPSIIPLCDHTLAVEKERDEIKAKLDQNKCNSGHRTLPLSMWDCPECVRINREALEAKLRAADSLLAGLVEAVGRYRTGHDNSCDKSEDWEATCNCGDAELETALAAAKQHLEAARAVREEKPK